MKNSYNVPAGKAGREKNDASGMKEPMSKPIVPSIGMNSGGNFGSSKMNCNRKGGMPKGGK